MKRGGGDSENGADSDFLNLSTNPTNISASNHSPNLVGTNQHDCLSLMELESTAISPVKEAPIPDAKNLFVDGSRYYTQDGKPHTGYAVTTVSDIVEKGSLSPHMSAQEAELWALARACELHRGHRINVYTDSRYAHGISHDFGPIWKARGFLTSSGKPVKHAELINRLFTAFSLPQQIAILKVKAHSGETGEEARGNSLADQTAREGALTPLRGALMLAVPANVSLEEFKKLQSQAGLQEKAKWTASGASEGADGIWGQEGKWCLPRALFPMVAHSAHYPGHQSKMAMCAQVEEHWIAPGFSTAASIFAASCLTCALHNPGKTVVTPKRHSPKPDYPFQRIQIDYISLPKSGPYEYALVCVDMFSGWPEAWPVACANASTTAKKILSEIVCRWGLPETIESDRGSHFTGQIFAEVCKALHINQGLHTPYHPQSSGKVERLNGIIKNRISKIMADTRKPWPECLPIALYSIRNAPRQPHGLSPYEVLFGSPPKTGLYFPQQLSSLHSQLTGYVQSLQKELQKIHHRVRESLPDPNVITGFLSIQPGDWVVLRKHQRTGLEPRYIGPFQVLLTTATSLKLEGRDNWVHASHCKKLFKDLRE